MIRSGSGAARVPAGAGGRAGGARAAVLPLAAAAIGAGLLALGAAAGEGPAAAASGIYLDGPPPGHTGGFDEPTCRACHFDRELNPRGGEVRLEGVPGRYVADSVYDVSVVLAHGETGRAGFQLAARWRTGRREGCSAGDLRPGRAEGVRAATADGEDGCEVVYLQHTEAGTGPVEDEDGVVRWRVRWRAPSGADGPVAFHVAANAANDDASEFGDRIYASEAVARPRE